MSTLTSNQKNNVIVKNAIFLSVIHDMFNVHDTHVVILVLLKTVDGLNHYPNIRQYTRPS
jgi:hypothetical protein